jgi:phosphopantetheinyl transferase
MPVTWRKTSTNYSIVVWQSKEPIAELLKNANLNKEELAEWNSFQSEKRKREWLTVRNALKTLVSDDESSTIIYDSNGKPHLSKSSISISHSHEFIAVMISDSPSIGIDIEVVHPRIEILSRKFLSEKEKPDLSDTRHLEKLHVLWGAKEVLFKIHSIGGIDFKKDLFVHPFNYENPGLLTASILKPGYVKNYPIQYEKIERHMLTWSASET